MKAIAAVVTLVVFYMAALMVAPLWLETDMLIGLLVFVGVAIIAGVWWAALTNNEECS